MLLAASILTFIGPARSAEIYNITASNVVTDQPAPLFTTNTISGVITLGNSVAPGQAFGVSSVLGIALNFRGITGTLADIVAADGTVQIFGTRSANGQSFSRLDFRFDFPSTTAGCSIACSGQIIISGTDPSNFIADDDFDATTLSVISSFTPRIQLAPEPTSLAIFCTGLLALARGRRLTRN